MGTVILEACKAAPLQISFVGSGDKSDKFQHGSDILHSVHTLSCTRLFSHGSEQEGPDAFRPGRKNRVGSGRLLSFDSGFSADLVLKASPQEDLRAEEAAQR